MGILRSSPSIQQEKDRKKALYPIQPHFWPVSFNLSYLISTEPFSAAGPLRAKLR